MARGPRLGRAGPLRRTQIFSWHRARATNGPTEAISNLRQRVAFGLRRFAHYRIRALPYAGRPSWDILAAVTPR